MPSLIRDQFFVTQKRTLEKKVFSRQIVEGEDKGLRWHWDET